MSDKDRVTLADLGVSLTPPTARLDPLGHAVGLAEGSPRIVPDLIGLGFMDAHASAAATGLRLSVSAWATTVGPWGRVLDQWPEPSVPVRRGGRLEITVSVRPQEPVPDVSGLPLGDAIERLVWLGFVPLADAQRPSRSVLAGHVRTTRPAAGALLACGSVVALTVESTKRELIPAGSGAGDDR